MVPPPAGEDVAPRQVREEQNPFFSRLEKLGHSPSSPSSVPPSNARRYGEQSALRYPKTAAGLRFSLQFSTAAEIAGSLFLPPAARACNSPAGGSTAGYRGCQLLHIDRGASRGNPKGARKPRLVVSMREGPGRGRNPKSSPPWCRFLWYLSFGQAKERYALCAGKGRRPLRHPAERDTPGDTSPCAGEVDRRGGLPHRCAHRFAMTENGDLVRSSVRTGAPSPCAGKAMGVAS